MNTIGIHKPSNLWKKLLYLKQPFPDNYTDELFLSQLKRNEDISHYSYWQLVSDFGLIVFHVNNLTLVTLVFMAMYKYNWDAKGLAGTTTILSFLGFIVWEINFNHSYHHNEVAKLKSFTLVMFILLMVSPVLKSLTKSTASDSIWLISFMLNVANIMVHDYGITSPNEFRPIVSTNFSVSNALVLASRLSSTLQVFCFIVCAIQITILLPIFDFSLRKLSLGIHHALIVTLVMTALALVYDLCGVSAAVSYGVVEGGILLILPAYFMFLQRYKNELQGPWDIARPTLRGGHR